MWKEVAWRSVRKASIGSGRIDASLVMMWVSEWMAKLLVPPAAS